MSTEPLVWIILVNWNGKAVTLECLSSLRSVTYLQRKTLVVDNASEDGSVEAIHEMYPDVYVLTLPENRRFAGGNNAGISYALEHGAQMLMLLNNDTTVDPGFLLPMVERLRLEPDVGIVSPKIYYHGRNNQLWFAGGKLSFWTGTMRHIGIREVDRGQYDTATDIDYGTGCCILTRKDVVEKTGLLDESYHLYAEDADWSMRVRQLGYRILYEPRARVWHKLSVSSGGHLSWNKMSNKFLGNFRFFAKYANWYHWPVFPWLNLLVNALAGIRYVITSRR
jgi:GT2 family glycosyltransferase